MMKLNKDYITHSTDDETLLVPTCDAGFFGLVRGNQTLGAMLEQLQAETTETAVVAALCAEFDAPEAVIADDVKTALDMLRSIGALDE